MDSSTTPFRSRVIRIYIDSQMTSTRAKMANMTQEQIDLADAIYASAEANYETGGHWVVETMEPWLVVERFATLADAESHWRLVEDVAQDVRAAGDCDAEYDQQRRELYQGNHYQSADDA